MINNLKSFLRDNKLELIESIDTYLMKVPALLIPNLVHLIKLNGAAFEALLAIKRIDQHALLKYCFNPYVQGKLLILEVPLELSHPSITRIYPIAAIYETAIAKKHSLSFNGLEELKAPSHNPPEFNPAPELSSATIIPVGPVHAGIIEPGHFRFTAFGEHINKLEISLGYLHRNIEDSLIGCTIEEGLKFSQYCCGDSNFSYALAYAQSVEKILQVTVPEPALYSRSILAEMERLYNHVGDVAVLINDTGFALGFARIIALKESLLRLNHEIWGHRFLRNTLSVAGVKHNLSKEHLAKLKSELAKINKEFSRLIAMVRSNNGVLERFRNTGIISHTVAQELSVSGLVGRASGLAYDARRDYSYAAYAALRIEVHSRRQGDVLARYNTRLSEINESFTLVNRAIDFLLDDNASSVQTSLNPARAGEAYSFVETARGPVLCYLELDARGHITYCRFRDISLHNWRALEHAVLHNIVADFPLANKSFSLAYAGTDM